MNEIQQSIKRFVGSEVKDNSAIFEKSLLIAYQKRTDML